MIPSKISILNFAKIFLLSLVLFSCNKDETENQSVDINDFSNIVLLLSDINTSEIKTKITYQFSGSNATSVLTKILFRLDSENNYTESAEGIVNGLLKGRKYHIKGLIEIDGKQKESEEYTFVTLGFESTNLIGTVEDYEKREYLIYDQQGKASFTESAELKGYLKVGSDSLLLESIEVINDNQIQIVLPQDTQDFFENDTEHIIRKEFTVGLFSGEYYKEIEESILGRTSNFYIENDKHFTLYNKLPFIDSILLNAPFYRRYDCEGISKIQFQIVGGFGRHKGSFLRGISSNEYEQISITINRNEPTSNEPLSSLNYSSFAENGTELTCAIEQYRSFENFNNPSQGMEHTFTDLQFSLFGDPYVSGNYQIQFSGVNYGGEIWSSNTFDFTIE